MRGQYIIGEKGVYLYFIGDIVFATEYLYRGKRPGSNHMFVILEKPNEFSRNYKGLIISSKYEKRHFIFVEKLKNNKLNKLRKNSIVYCNDLIRLKPENIKHKIGQINADDYYRFTDCLEKYKTRYLNRKYK